MKRFLIPAAVLLLNAVAVPALAAPGTVLRDEKLHSQPSVTSSVAGRAAKGSSVNILTKQGGWLRVSSGKSTGWIRLLSVRAGPGGLGGARLGDVVGAATTKSDPSRVVAVAGLRGLNNEDLKRAQFNADELARLDAWVVTPAQARQFAGQSGLVAVNVAALPKPASNAQSKPAQEPSAWEAN